jgi:hypothetical protein
MLFGASLLDSTTVAMVTIVLWWRWSVPHGTPLESIRLLR